MGEAYFGFYLLAMGRGRPRRPEEIHRMIAAAGFASSRLLPTPTPLLTRVILAETGEG
jgi:demethylspheroidene O-methyltransferase